MAEGIFKSKTADYKDYLNISSCGLSAFPGDAASPNAVKAMADREIDISHHRSRPINQYIIEEADIIVCMTESHYSALYPTAKEKLLLLGGGIPDPFMGDEKTYSLCADKISDAIDALLDSDVFFKTENMTQGDIKAVAEIEKKCFSEPWSEESFKSQLQKDYSVCFVTRYLGKPVGYVCADSVIGEVYIGNIAVDVNMRRKHIADGLMTKLIDYCEENHSELLTLEVRVSNIPALNLYGKYGFKVAGKRKNFYTKPTEDGYIMTRVFSHS